MKKREITTNIILDAAVSVFADVGFSGARMDEIALKAGVNKATIYYTIGNKEALYSKVLESVFADKLPLIEKKITETGDPNEKLRIYVQSIAAAIDNKPGFPNILMWEHASGGLNMPENIIRIIAGMLNLLRTILNDGYEMGIFKKVNPILIQFMVISTMVFYKTSEPIRQQNPILPDIVRDLPEDLTGEISNQIESLVLSAVQK